MARNSSFGLNRFRGWTRGDFAGRCVTIGRRRDGGPGTREALAVEAARLAIPRGHEAIATAASLVDTRRDRRRPRHWSAACATTLPGGARLSEGAGARWLAVALGSIRHHRSRRAAHRALRRRAGAAPAMVGGGRHGPRPRPGRRRPVALAALVLPVRGHARRARIRARCGRYGGRLAR